MRQLFKKSLAFALGLIAFAGLLEAVLFVQMHNRRAHVHEDWPDMVGLDADIVLLGNSRTAGHAIPKVMEEGLGLKVYNLAYDGYTAQMGAYRLDYLLEHAKKLPSVVMLQTDLSFCRGDAKQENYPMKDGVLRYFFWDQIGINKYYRNYDNWREADTFIPLLRYKGYPLIFFKHLFRWNRWDRREESGFWHKDKSVGFELEAPPESNETPVSFAKIDSICTANDIDLICIVPPSPKAIYRPSHDELRRIEKTYPVWDFSTLFHSNESDRFYDGAHFDYEGAQIYSKKLQERLQEWTARRNKPADSTLIEVISMN